MICGYKAKNEEIFELLEKRYDEGVYINGTTKMMLLKDSIVIHRACGCIEVIKVWTEGNNIKTEELVIPCKIHEHIYKESCNRECVDEAYFGSDFVEHIDELIP